MDGFEALERLKADTQRSDIPVIFLTSVTDAVVEARGFQMGVVDFITKPFSAPVLLNRIKTHLDIDGLIRDRTAKLLHLQNGIVFVLADMVENRDHNTGGHIERTTSYMKILADALIADGVYAQEIIGMDVEQLVSSARLHDVGKICIPDRILNKPGRLTPEEFEVMKTHATEGERIIEQIVSRADDGEFLHNAKYIAGYHHERWDGKGYPNALSGEAIPLQGRMMAVVDVYDALTSARPYKQPFSHEDAAKIILDNAGTQFDPAIIEVFDRIQDRFEAVKLGLAEALA